MVQTKKKFDYTVSKKFPSGEIVSVTFGTVIEKDVEDTDEAREALFQEVVTSTAKDIKTAMKKDKVVRVAWNSLQDAVKNQEKVGKAKERMKDYE